MNVFSVQGPGCALISQAHFRPHPAVLNTPHLAAPEISKPPPLFCVFGVFARKTHIASNNKLAKAAERLSYY